MVKYHPDVKTGSRVILFEKSRMSVKTCGLDEGRLYFPFINALVLLSKTTSSNLNFFHYLIHVLSRI